MFVDRDFTPEMVLEVARIVGIKTAHITCGGRFVFASETELARWQYGNDVDHKELCGRFVPDMNVHTAIHCAEQMGTLIGRSIKKYGSFWLVMDDDGQWIVARSRNLAAAICRAILYDAKLGSPARSDS